MKKIIKFFRNYFTPVALKHQRRLLQKSMRDQHAFFNSISLQILKKNDYIWELPNASIYIPNYPEDFIQRTIVASGGFYEKPILNTLDGFIKKDSVICDIGANIGNHSLYWLIDSGAKYIYCFEPRQETYHILKKNMKLNNFEDKVSCFQLGLSDKNSNLSMKYFSKENIGGTQFENNQNGDIQCKALDSLNLEHKIDFMKIDVEGMERYVLEGAKNTISKDKPLIFIEIFEENITLVDNKLKEMGYSMIKKFPEDNYLYQIKEL